MKNMLARLGLVVALMASQVGFSAALADEPAGSLTTDQALTTEQAKELLLASRPDLPVDEVIPGPVPGFFEVRLTGGMRLYMNDTAEFLFAGDLYFVRDSGLVNATEASRTDARKDLLDSLDESEMVVFSPASDKVKTTITVFTDIDCGYCRKLHAEVPDLNRLGIAVRYLAYPRAGVGSKSYDKLVSAWCADNAQVALTKAKLGQEIDDLSCDNPVAKHMVLGEQFGVTGTPAIVYEDGRLQAGYAPADEMARRLGIN